MGPHPLPEPALPVPRGFAPLTQRVEHSQGSRFAPSTLSCVPGSGPASCPAIQLPPYPLQSYVGMCVAVRDERDLGEWLDHYRALGVGAFYLYDHNATRPLATHEPKLLDQPDIRYEYFNRINPWSEPQMAIYNACLAHAASRHRWLGMLDVDEFVFIRRGVNDLRQVLMQFDVADVGGLALNWQQYGASNHTERPDGNVVDNYFQCFPFSNPNCQHVKLFVNSRHVLRVDFPHTANFRAGKYAVNENMAAVTGPFSSPPSGDWLRIAHYVVKSEEDFREKMARGAVHGNVTHDMEFFHGVNEDATQICRPQGQNAEG
jgi:hypothetical protein